MITHYEVGRGSEGRILCHDGRRTVWPASTTCPDCRARLGLPDVTSTDRVLALEDALRAVLDAGLRGVYEPADMAAWLTAHAEAMRVLDV